MTSIVPTFAYKQETIAFVENGLWAGKRQFGACTALGFANEQEGLVAGFIYHNYDPAAGVIEVSGYSTRRDWCNKRRLKTLFDYPFNHVGVRLVAARHSEHNTRVRRIWRSLGATETLIPDMWGPDEAEAVIVLKRETWKNSKLIGPQSHG
jgi:RimJ/RimL family protein N-acetyltransferase